MTYAAKIIADSSASGTRLTTMEVTFPRFILAEFNTHRMLSRNSASSRAIPVERRIAQVRENPFVPEAFGQNQRGMQAAVELDERDNSKAVAVWLRARDAAVAQAEALLDLGVHKQHANRILEPYVWHTVVVTATEWENFFALRTHKAAQPEMQIIAKMMREVYDASTPRELEPGDWHLPYVDSRIVDTNEAITATAPDGSVTHGISPWREGSPDELLWISVARCAAVSYERQDAQKTVEEYRERHDALLAAGHMSPFEHQAQVMAGGTDCPFAPRYVREGNIWCGGGYFCRNFRAPFLQYRATLPGESVWRGENA